MGSRVISDTNSDPNSDCPARSEKRSEKKAYTGGIAFSDSSDAQHFRRRGPEIDFREALPALGAAIDIDGLTFRFIEAQPYTRVTDGRASTLLVWSGRCADCATPIIVKTGVVAQSVNKRCDIHKAKGRPATAAARARRDTAWATYRLACRAGRGVGA